jgi:hypothetical protein
LFREKRSGVGWNLQCGIRGARRCCGGWTSRKKGLNEEYVASLLDLVRPLLRERNAENENLIVVGGLHINVSLDQTLPLVHQRPELVRGEVHALNFVVFAFSLRYFNWPPRLL